MQIVWFLSSLSNPTGMTEMFWKENYMILYNNCINCEVVVRGAAAAAWSSPASGWWALRRPCERWTRTDAAFRTIHPRRAAGSARNPGCQLPPFKTNIRFALILTDDGLRIVLAFKCNQMIRCFMEMSKFGALSIQHLTMTGFFCSSSRLTIQLWWIH